MGAFAELFRPLVGDFVVIAEKDAFEHIFMPASTSLLSLSRRSMTEILPPRTARPEPYEELEL